jgi:hypothetical protein
MYHLKCLFHSMVSYLIIVSYNIILRWLQEIKKCNTTSVKHPIFQNSQTKKLKNSLKNQFLSNTLQAMAYLDPIESIRITLKSKQIIDSLKPSLNLIRWLPQTKVTTALNQKYMNLFFIAKINSLTNNIFNRFHSRKGKSRALIVNARAERIASLTIYHAN